jgi:predicted kinase
MSLTRPRLIVVFGPPGSGKSTLARALASHFGAAYLDSDTITAPFFGEDRDSDEYRRLRPTLYEALYALAASNLALGLSVVLDGPHGSVLADQLWLERVTTMTGRAGADVGFIRCACDTETMRRRMIARGEPRDGLKLTRWVDFVASQPDWRETAFPHLTVDTTTSAPDTMLARVLAWLEGRGPAA